MAEILKNGQVHQDHWQVLRPEAEADLATLNVPKGEWLVPFTLWQAQKETLKYRQDIGVWLSPNDDLTEVANHFDQWPLLAIDFPKFTDGRGYSIAPVNVPSWALLLLSCLPPSSPRGGADMSTSVSHRCQLSISGCSYGSRAGNKR